MTIENSATGADALGPQDGGGDRSAGVAMTTGHAQNVPARALERACSAEPVRGALLEGDLMIFVDEVAGDVTWQGTRAQIEAEGVLPAVLPEFVAWPDDFSEESWTQDGFGWRLSRVRPKGGRAAIRALTTAPDDWKLRRTPGGLATWHLHAAVLRKSRELAAAAFEASEAGRDRRMEQFERGSKARKDAAFQQMLHCIGAR